MANRSKLATLAWRNIWRNRRRTAITLFGIAFGVLFAVLVTGLGDASYGQMIDYAAKMGGGHVSVQHEDYRETPSLDQTVRADDALTASIETDPEVLHALPRVSGATMLATAANSYGAFFMAIDPSREDESTTAFLGAISEGRMLEGPDDKGIVLGATLAENLDVELDKKVVLTMTDKSGEIVSGLTRVRGIVKTGAPSLDGGLALLSIGHARELLGYAPDESTQIAIFVRDHRDSAQVAARIRGQLQAPSVALSWEESSPELAGFIAMKMGSNWIMQVFIMVLMAAGIFNTLFVSVMERLREFGIMAALGFSRLQLFALVMWESVWIAIFGLVAAAAFTGPLYYYLNTKGIDYSAMVGEGAEVAGVALLEPVLYVDIYFVHVLAIAGIVVVATLAAGLYPAWRAGRVPPADAIRLV